MHLFIPNPSPGFLLCFLLLRWSFVTFREWLSVPSRNNVGVMLYGRGKKTHSLPLTGITLLPESKGVFLLNIYERNVVMLETQAHPRGHIFIDEGILSLCDVVFSFLIDLIFYLQVQKPPCNRSCLWLLNYWKCYKVECVSTDHVSALFEKHPSPPESSGQSGLLFQIVQLSSLLGTGLVCWDCHSKWTHIRMAYNNRHKKTNCPRVLETRSLRLSSHLFDPPGTQRPDFSMGHIPHWQRLSLQHILWVSPIRPRYYFLFP